MEIKFDLEQDELPVFLGETEEQLQVLDDGLIQLERKGDDADLIQTLFRAAHTLKGGAGMINHKRMVTLTHALENALDGLRKNQFSASPSFVDLCLEAVDALRVLRDEIINGQVSDVNIDELAGRFSEVSLKKSQESEEKSHHESEESHIPSVSDKGSITGVILIHAEISDRSIASAARALQVVFALQEMGTIVSQEPSMEIIETAKPVKVVKAVIQSELATEEIEKILRNIGEVEIASAVREGEKREIPEKIVEPVNITAPEITTDGNEIAKQEIAKSTQKAPVPGKQVVEKTVRTSVERLDNLMNLVGELITDRNRLFQLRGYFQTQLKGDERSESLSETVTHIGRITDQLQKEVMGIRMQPVSTVFNKFPRMVRDLAKTFGKNVDFVIRGEDTELDRSVIEEINDPLIHLLRNSVDHGIEDPIERQQRGKSDQARILLEAHHEQGRIVLSVEDDGRGIDTDKVLVKAIEKGLITEVEAANMSNDDAVQLIFLSGFSTAKKVSDISGRGVGLDIVRNNIQRLNGSIHIETWHGKGSRFQITLPLTLAIVPTLLVRVSQSIFAIPLVTVSTTLRIGKKDIQTVNNRPVTILRNSVLPLLDLASVFHLPAERDEEYQHVVVVASGKNLMGLVVDRLLGQEEVVVKSLGPLVGDIYGVASAAILGDGQVILIIDIQDLFRYNS